MKKLLGVILFGLFMISMIGVVSAKTLVAGIIYDDNGIIVDSANVTVTCDHTTGSNTGSYSITTESLDDGSYAVKFYEDTSGQDNCDTGDEVTVYAEKGEMSGIETGIVIDKGSYPGVNINLALINVTVPEFGVFLGALTLLSAVGVFFLVRRE